MKEIKLFTDEKLNALLSEKNNKIKHQNILEAEHLAVVTKLKEDYNMTNDGYYLNLAHRVENCGPGHRCGNKFCPYCAEIKRRKNFSKFMRMLFRIKLNNVFEKYGFKQILNLAKQAGLKKFNYKTISRFCVNSLAKNIEVHEFVFKANICLLDDIRKVQKQLNDAIKQMRDKFKDLFYGTLSTFEVKVTNNNQCIVHYHVLTIYDSHKVLFDEAFINSLQLYWNNRCLKSKSLNNIFFFNKISSNKELINKLNYNLKGFNGIDFSKLNYLNTIKTLNIIKPKDVIAFLFLLELTKFTRLFSFSGVFSINSSLNIKFKNLRRNVGFFINSFVPILRNIFCKFRFNSGPHTLNNNVSFLRLIQHYITPFRFVQYVLLR